MVGGNGPQSRFTVDFTGFARSQLRAIARRAIYGGRGREVAAAVRTILARLSQDQREYGEPMYHLRAMRMHVRRAALAPLYVEYGVHEDQPIVIIRYVARLRSRT